LIIEPVSSYGKPDIFQKKIRTKKDEKNSKDIVFFTCHWFTRVGCGFA
jgi:hypothetical protein